MKCDAIIVFAAAAVVAGGGFQYPHYYYYYYSHHRDYHYYYYYANVDGGFVAQSLLICDNDDPKRSQCWQSCGSSSIGRGKTAAGEMVVVADNVGVYIFDILHHGVESKRSHKML